MLFHITKFDNCCLILLFCCSFMSGSFAAFQAREVLFVQSEIKHCVECSDKSEPYAYLETWNGFPKSILLQWKVAIMAEDNILKQYFPSPQAMGQLKLTCYNFVSFHLLKLGPCVLPFIRWPAYSSASRYVHTKMENGQNEKYLERHKQSVIVRKDDFTLMKPDSGNATSRAKRKQKWSTNPIGCGNVTQVYSTTWFA